MLCLYLEQHIMLLRSDRPPFGIRLSLMLPVFQEAAHSRGGSLSCNVETYHGYCKSNHTVSQSWPNPVLPVNQPLFAIAKQIQWEWPLQYGDMVMFGGLHLQMVAFKIIGDLLKDSGRTGVLAGAEIATPGTADSFISASHVKKTCLAPPGDRLQFISGAQSRLYGIYPGSRRRK